jgi:ABC-type branched-subunit amino acid transport system ATPase component
VSFDVRQGEILGIVGPNGAGKSTLIDMVTGVQVPDSGKVVLDGKEMTEGPAFRAHRGMARTFQHPLLRSTSPFWIMFGSVIFAKGRHEAGRVFLSGF